MSEFAAVVFDVLGTVVDEERTTERETTEQFVAAGLDGAQAAEVARAWLARLSDLVGEAVARRAPWEPNDALRRRALHEALSPEDRAALGVERITHLETIGHRLEPWPDSPAALGRIAERRMVVALTNGNLSQSAAMSAAADLRWHCLLSADAVQAFKPDAAMYRLPLEQLDLVAEQTLFAAAHPWDLRGAREHGYRTAFIARPGAELPERPDEFDLRADSLAGLAELLA